MFLLKKQLNFKSKLTLITLLVVLSSIFFSKFAFAYYFDGYRSYYAGETAWYDSSIANLGYTGDYDKGRGYWNYSPYVDIGKNTGTYQKYQDKYFIGTTAVNGLLGHCLPVQYRTDANGKEYAVVYDDQTNANSDILNEWWDYTIVTLFDNSMKATGSQFTSTYVSYNAAHEIGHSIKMKHAPDGYYAGLSVMDQGWNPLYYNLMEYDAQEVTNKWGFK